MSQALEGLRAYEDGNTLFYACPLTPDELEHVLIDDQLQPGIRPSVPMCYNSGTGLFEPHGSEAVVCAGIAVETVVFHGLARAAAQCLPPPERRSGWDADANGAVTRVNATKKLNDCVQDLGSGLKAYVYRLPRTTPPFVPFTYKGESIPFEWRSRTPVLWQGDVVEITGTCWPRHLVDIVPPFPS